MNLYPKPKIRLIFYTYIPLQFKLKECFLVETLHTIMSLFSKKVIEIKADSKPLKKKRYLWQAFVTVISQIGGRRTRSA